MAELHLGKPLWVVCISKKGANPDYVLGEPARIRRNHIWGNEHTAATTVQLRQPLSLLVEWSMQRACERRVLPCVIEHLEAKLMGVRVQCKKKS